MQQVELAAVQGHRRRHHAVAGEAQRAEVLRAAHRLALQAGHQADLEQRAGHAIRAPQRGAGRVVRQAHEVRVQRLAVAAELELRDRLERRVVGARRIGRRRVARQEAHDAVLRVVREQQQVVGGVVGHGALQVERQRDGALEVARVEVEHVHAARHALEQEELRVHRVHAQGHDVDHVGGGRGDGRQQDDRRPQGRGRQRQRIEAVDARADLARRVQQHAVDRVEGQAGARRHQVARLVEAVADLAVVEEAVLVGGHGVEGEVHRRIEEPLRAAVGAGVVEAPPAALGHVVVVRVRDVGDLHQVPLGVHHGRHVVQALPEALRQAQLAPDVVLGRRRRDDAGQQLQIDGVVEVLEAHEARAARAALARADDAQSGATQAGRVDRRPRRHLSGRGHRDRACFGAVRIRPVRSHADILARPGGIVRAGEQPPGLWPSAERRATAFLVRIGQRCRTRDRGALHALVRSGSAAGCCRHPVRDRSVAIRAARLPGGRAGVVRRVPRPATVCAVRSSGSCRNRRRHRAAARARRSRRPRPGSASNGRRAASRPSGSAG